MTPDALNGIFELIGGILIWFNVYRLHKDKHTAGVSILPVTFYTLWGVFNLWFYPSMGAWWSFAGGILVVLANTIWRSQMLKYRKAA